MAERRYEKKERYGSRERYYVDGNTVRKTYTQVAPDIRPVSPRKTAPEAKPSVQPREKVNVGYIFTLSIAAVAIVVLSILFLSMQAENNANKKAIAAMQTQITDLATDNDIREIEIYSNIDYDKLYNKALSLGMGSAKPSQIITYDRGTLEYVKQYADIPTEK